MSSTRINHVNSNMSTCSKVVSAPTDPLGTITRGGRTDNDLGTYLGISLYIGIGSSLGAAMISDSPTFNLFV